MGHGGCGCTGGCAAADVEGSPGAAGPGRRGVAPGPDAVSRRGVLAGSAVVITTLALAACSSDDGGSGSGASDGSGEASAADPGAASGTRLAGTDDFPVGGGAVVSTDAGVVVVTHPADGEYKAFNGKCPHQGCPVTEVTENVIVCQCHGSTFDGESGDRLDGPAPRGLSEVEITVEGDGIYLA